jgi:hypothetical protein
LLLGTLDKTHFQSEPCLAAFERLHSVAKKRSIILSYTELVEDPALNEEYRDVLREAESKVCRSKRRASTLIENLGKYRKTRIAYYLAKEVLEKLKQPQVEIDEVLNSITEHLNKARVGEDLTSLVRTIGRNANAIDLVDEALSEDDEILLKTGFDEIDNKNGGVPSVGVMLLAATTSGGKSTMLMNMLMNMYKINKVSVANVSLEMNERKVVRRMLSRMTQIPYWKYTKKALSPEERAKSKRAWLRFHRYGEKNDCQFSLICPKHAVSGPQVFTLLRPYGFNVVGIDYVSLLEGIDEKDQWKALSSIVRQAKIFSAENNCLVILLAQLDSEDDRIRYSKGMLEHADTAWTWNYYKPEQRETKVLPIKQIKARDQELYPFELAEMFETMTIDNMAGATKPGSASSKPGSGADVALDDEPAVDYEAGHK